MKKIIKKDRDIEIYKAFKSLEEAIAIEEPDITICVPNGLEDNPRDREFLQQLNAFVRSYRKFSGLKKVNLKIIS